MNFKVHNGARDTATRLQRAERPTHGGLKQFIMNGTRRLVRGRPVQISLEQLKQHIEEFRTKEKEGILYVTTMDDRVVNLYDDRFPAAPSVPLPNPRPEPPLDSANNDKPTGHNMNVHPREVAPPKEFTMPVEPPVAATDNPVLPPEASDPAPGLLELGDPAADVVLPVDQPLETLAGLEKSSEESAEGTEAVAQAEEKSSEAKSSSKKDKSKKNR
jgi:hypothetical protein